MYALGLAQLLGLAGYSVAEPETLRCLDHESILYLGARPSEAVLIMSEEARGQDA